MKAAREHQRGATQRIEDSATSWAVRLDEDRSAETRAEFECWRAADARHAAAFARMAAMRGALGRLATTPHGAELSMVARAAAVARARRRVMLQYGLGLAAAAAVMLGIFLRPARLVDDGPAEQNFTAESFARPVTLPDGSRVKLNAGARISVAFSGGERRVTLLTGEAHFSVMKDPARPFVVSAGTVSVRAIGTAFNVRLETAEVEVLVTEGRVEVATTAPTAVPEARSISATPPAAVAAPAIVPLLEAGHRLLIDTTSGAEKVEPKIEAVDQAGIDRALAWQSSVLVFAETPLGEIVEQFNRRNRVQLVIEDQELATRRVGGNIRVDAPDTFVRVLETSGAIAVDRSEPGRIVLRKVR